MAAAYMRSHETLLESTLSEEKLLGLGKPSATFTGASEEVVDGRLVTRFRFLAITPEDAQKAVAVLRAMWPGTADRWPEPAELSH
ncbi:MAG TPA: hypothetical protein VK963_01405 [Candidatus Saccharimonadales bacterium]|nr:hypothetical protein [Candidatus Saccharimonadales bacterium]